MNLLFIVLLLIYFFSGAHQKVLGHFGLSKRDNSLMFLGIFTFGVIVGTIGCISALIAGTSIVGHLLSLVINGLFMYLNYREL